MPKLIDMTNWIMREHGVPDSRITVIQLADHKYKDGHTPWVCKCDCGNIFEALGTHIRKGRVKSCGCLNKEQASQNAIKRNIKDKPSLIDMTGWVMKEHGVECSKLTVLEYLGDSIWKCQCECGGICNVNSTALRNGTTRSCGCLTSLNEVRIRNILKQYNISFKEQQTFDDLILQHKLRFDFGIYKDNNLLFVLEYQGQQHYKDTKFGHYSRITDPIKKQYCQEKNIKLYEIKYNDNLKATLLSILRKEGFDV